MPGKDRTGDAARLSEEWDAWGWTDAHPIPPAREPNVGPVPPAPTSEFPAVFALADLDGANGFRLTGVDAYDNSGFSVASAGDVNGDGIDDIIIGARSADPGGKDRAGESYVVFGREDGFEANLDLATLDGTNGFRLAGDGAGDQSGYSVASAGDVNGDGLDDIIIGAAFADYNRNPDAGVSYVVFGRSEGFDASLDLAALDGADGFRLAGVNPYDFGAFSVASAGDVNGDGFDDMVIGAIGADPGAMFSGEAYVVFGGPDEFDATLALATLDGANGFTIEGIALDDFVGQSVASAGDVNGDGFADIIIGAYGVDQGGGGQGGAAYVVFGKAEAFGVTFELSDLDGANGFRLAGIDAYDAAGFSVASAGDVNGDGFGDIIVGAPYADPDGVNLAGESYVVFGKAEGFSANLELAALDGTDGFRLEGTDGFDGSGFSVASAGDVNGDGFGDVVIGAYRGYSGDALFSGESYVVYGKARGFDASIDLAGLDGADGFRIDGVEALDRSGYSGAGAGDVNRDGFDDVMVGAVTAAGEAGESYVIFGRAPTTAVERIGAAGDQVIKGGAFDDTLSGLGGDDTLGGGDGADEMAGGIGDDNYFVDDAGDIVIELADEGADKVRTSVDFDADGLEVETIIAKSGQGLALSSGDNATRIRGDVGDDTLTGGAGKDTLKGGEGDDRIVVTEGGDLLRGEAGADMFALDDDIAAGDGATLRDFVGGTDSFEIDAVDFGGGLAPGALDPDAFVANTTGAAEDAEDRFVYNAASGELLFDVDGNGSVESVLLATLTGAPTIQASDFIVI